MRLVGIICFFEERPSWLCSSVGSFCRLGLDHVVAVDGAYKAFPEGAPRSGPEQHEALAEIVRPFGVGLTLHAPNRLWESEVEKRTFAFRLAEQLTTEDDWYVVFDADELSSAFNLKKALASTDKLVAECLSWERFTGKEASAEGSMVGSTSVRRFYRALRGLHVEDTHTTYKAGDLILRGYGEDELEPSQDLPVRVEHRWNFQEPIRRLRQETYYRLRDAEEAEQRTCYRCSRRSVITAPTDFEIGEPDPVRLNLRCKWVEVCTHHLAPILAANEERLAELCADPESVQTRLGFDLKRATWLASQASPDAARAASA